MTDYEESLRPARARQRAEKLHAAHPVETCELFRTKTGRCTCQERTPPNEPDRVPAGPSRGDTMTDSDATLTTLADKVEFILSEWSETMQGDPKSVAVVRGMSIEIRSALAAALATPTTEEHVHAADMHEGESGGLPICAMSEYSGHGGPCRPLATPTDA